MHSEWTKKVQISALARTTDLCTNNQTKCHDISKDLGDNSGVFVLSVNYVEKLPLFVDFYIFFMTKKDYHYNGTVV